MPGSSDPMSPRRQDLRTAAGAESQRLARGHRRGAAASARDEQRILHLDEEIAALVRRRCRRRRAPRAHRRRAGRAPARHPPRAAGSRSGSARRRPARPNVSTSPAERWTQCAHQTSSAIQPTRSRYSTGVQAKSSRQYASSSTVSARCVCSCSPSLRASAADSSISRVVTENGEQGATTICTARRPRRCEPLGVGEDRVDVLDEVVGRQPAVRLTEVHRAARGDDAHAELLRGAHLRFDEPRDAAREDVMVVEDGRAPRERELGEPGARRGVLHLFVDPRPRRIERLQPGEEVGLLRAGARERLVQVVVRVDQARRDDRAAEVFSAAGGRRRRPRRSAVLDAEPAALVLGAGVVHRHDPGVRRGSRPPGARARNGRHRRGPDRSASGRGSPTVRGTRGLEG